MIAVGKGESTPVRGPIAKNQENASAHDCPAGGQKGMPAYPAAYIESISSP
jgi:hypothetical protein